MGLISNNNAAAIRAIAHGAREKKLYLWLQADTPDDVAILGHLPFKAIWCERGNFGLLHELQNSPKLSAEAESKQFVGIPSTIGGTLSYDELIPVVFTRGEGFQYDGISSLTLSRKDRSNRDEQLIEFTEILTSGVVVVACGNDVSLVRTVLEDELLNSNDPVLPNITGLQLVLVSMLDTDSLVSNLQGICDLRREDVLFYQGDVRTLTEKCVQEIGSLGAETSSEFFLRVLTRDGMRNIPIDDLLHGTGRRLFEDYHFISSKMFEEIRPVQREKIFKKLLSDSDPVWEGYQAGFLFERFYKLSEAHQKPRAFLGDDWDRLAQKRLPDVILQLLERSAGRRENYTVTLPADAGAGSTTLVRQVAFKMAALGYPVLIAKTSLTKIDYWQLTSFLTEFWRNVSHGGESSVESSCLLVFDVEHIGDLKTTELARLLENDGRNVIVLRVVPNVSNIEIRAADGRDLICPVMASDVGSLEATALYQHLCETTKSISSALIPRKESWDYYVRSTGKGNTLFWICLRYFILENLGSEEHGGLEDTITTKFTVAFEEMIRTQHPIAQLVSYLAVSTVFRIPVPYGILCHITGMTHQGLIDATKQVEERMKYLRIEWYGNNREDFQLAFSHTLFAELIINLIAKFAASIEGEQAKENVEIFGIGAEAVDPSYPVELFKPILSRLDHAKANHRRYAEKVAVEVLKIERREKNVDLFLANKMLAAFDYMPRPLIGSSPTILQARAITASKSCTFMKAHLEHTTGAENEEWQRLARTRFEQAKSDMEKAFDLLEDNEAESSEDPRVLKTTLANIYLAWSTFERSRNNLDDFNRISMDAGALYQAVIDDWPDSAYARYGLAKLLYENCSDDLNTTDGTGDVENLARALGALDIQPESSFHDHWVKLQSDILSKLDSEQYLKHVDSLIMRGYEIGFVIKARRIYQKLDTSHLDIHSIEEAILLLQRAQEAPNKSHSPASRQFLLYHCLSRHPRQQWNFPERYRLLSELNRSGFRLPLTVRYTYAVICFQMDRQEEGSRQFSGLHTGPYQGVQVDELEYWRESLLSYTGQRPEIRQTTMQVVSINPTGGWARVHGLQKNIPFSQRQPWGRTLVQNQRVPCSVQFFRSGPRAVPSVRERHEP